MKCPKKCKYEIPCDNFGGECFYETVEGKRIPNKRKCPLREIRILREMLRTYRLIDAAQLRDRWRLTEDGAKKRAGERRSMMRRQAVKAMDGKEK